MRSLKDIVAAGRPASGYAVTHDYAVRSLAQTAGMLPFGFVHESAVVKAYSWRRFTGRVRIEAGAAKVAAQGNPGRAIVNILAVCLDTLGAHKMGTAARENGDRLMSLSYSDIVFLLIDRALARNKGKLAVDPDLRCYACGESIGAERNGKPGILHIEPADIQIGCIDWRPDEPPMAVVWLDDPIMYDGKRITAFVETSVSWQSMFSGSTMQEISNGERTTVRAASGSVVGFVSDGQIVMSPIPNAVIEDLCDEGEFDRMAEAAYGCSGGASLMITKVHACGGAAVIPFDWTAEV